MRETFVDALNVLTKTAAVNKVWDIKPLDSSKMPSLWSQCNFIKFYLHVLFCL